MTRVTAGEGRVAFQGTVQDHDPSQALHLSPNQAAGSQVTSGTAGGRVALTKERHDPLPATNVLDACRTSLIPRNIFKLGA